MDADDTDEEPAAWITTENNHKVPLDENGIAMAGGGGTLEGKDFSDAESTSTAEQQSSSSKADTPEKKAAAARKAQYIEKLRKEKAELLSKEDIGDRACEMWNKGYLSMEEAVAAMEDGSIDKRIEEYYAIMEENGDPTSEKPLADNANHYNEELKAGKWESQDEAHLAYVKEETGLPDDECEQIHKEMEKWFHMAWKKADPAQLDKYIENDHTYDGEIYRGLHFVEGYDDMTFDEFMANIEVGGTISNNGRNSSWSSDYETALAFSQNEGHTGDRVILKCIRNRTASPVNKMSWINEEEVMAHSRAQWTVLNIEKYDAVENEKMAIITLVETGEYAEPSRDDGIMRKDSNKKEPTDDRPMSMLDRWADGGNTFIAKPRKANKKAANKKGKKKRK